MERDDTLGSCNPDPPGSQGANGPSSVELVRRARDGDRQALEHLFERYRPILQRWAAGRLPRWARELVDTEDMIQDTFMRTLRNVENFEPRHDGALGAYFRQAMHNRIRDEIRRVDKRPRRIEMEDIHPDAGASPLEAAIGREALEKYETALHRLSDENREIIIARIEMGMSYQEVAVAANKPSANAARMAVGRALMQLAKELDHG